MTILLAYIAYFIFASASPLQRKWLANKKDVSSKEQIHFSFEVFLIFAFGSLVLPFFSPFYLSGGTLKILLLTMACGSFGALCFVTNYVAQRHLDASVTSIVVNISTPVTIILSWILLKEGLHGVQILGTIFLLVSLFIISKRHHLGKFRFDKYFLLMLLSGITMGVLLVAERALQKTTGFTAGTMFSWWSQCIFLGIAALAAKTRHTYTKKEVLITGTLRFLQALSYVTLVWVVGNLSVVSSITTFKIVIVFIAAAVFLHEREDLSRKILGSIIALLGLMLMK